MTTVSRIADWACSVCSSWLGDELRVTPLYGEYDLNFRVETPDGARRVLKIMRDASEETRSLVELQIAMLRHLAGYDLGVECPRAVSAPAGEYTRDVRDPDGVERIAWLLTFIEGRLLDDVPVYSDDLLRGVGRAVGAVDRALRDFDDPRARRHLMWDLARAIEIRDLAPAVSDPERRELVDRMFRRFEEHAMPRLGLRPSSVIHNDGGNQHNMIVREAHGAVQITGIIDFGDAVRTHTVCGLAIASAYAAFGSDDPVDAMARVAVGYDRVLPLADADLELVVWLAATRLTMSVTIAARRATDNPDDSYTMVSAEPAWTVLEQLVAQDLDRATMRFSEQVHEAR
jgi:Ser/Thr protein kinase RdoA (MazF antagonist)